MPAGSSAGRMTTLPTMSAANSSAGATTVGIREDPSPVRTRESPHRVRDHEPDEADRARARGGRAREKGDGDEAENLCADDVAAHALCEIVPECDDVERARDDDAQNDADRDERDDGGRDRERPSVQCSRIPEPHVVEGPWIAQPDHEPDAVHHGADRDAGQQHPDGGDDRPSRHADQIDEDHREKRSGETEPDVRPRPRHTEQRDRGDDEQRCTRVDPEYLRVGERVATHGLDQRSGKAECDADHDREGGAGNPQLVHDPLVADVAVVGDGLPHRREPDVLRSDRQAGDAHERREATVDTSNPSQRLRSVGRRVVAAATAGVGAARVTVW